MHVGKHVATGLDTVGRSRAIFGLEVGSRCVNRGEEMDWSEPVAELYETCLENSMVGGTMDDFRLGRRLSFPPSLHVGRCGDARG